MTTDIITTLLILFGVLSIGALACLWIFVAMGERLKLITRPLGLRKVALITLAYYAIALVVLACLLWVSG